MSIFSERLIALIRKNGWTQRELAKRVGVTEQAISHYIKGYRTPHPDVLVRMAESLNTSTDYLLGVFVSEDSCVKLESMRRMERIQQSLSKLNPDQLKKAEKLLKIAFKDAFEDQE